MLELRESDFWYFTVYLGVSEGKYGRWSKQTTLGPIWDNIRTSILLIISKTILDNDFINKLTDWFYVKKQRHEQNHKKY
jgi:hypothetical protein